MLLRWVGPMPRVGRGLWHPMVAYFPSLGGFCVPGARCLHPALCSVRDKAVSRKGMLQGPSEAVQGTGSCRGLGTTCRPRRQPAPSYRARSLTAAPSTMSQASFSFDGSWEGSKPRSDLYGSTPIALASPEHLVPSDARSSAPAEDTGDPKARTPRAIILEPARELAEQVSDCLAAFKVRRRRRGSSFVAEPTSGPRRLTSCSGRSGRGSMGCTRSASIAEPPRTTWLFFSL